MEEENVNTVEVKPEDITKFLESEDGKRYIQPKIDSHFTKSLETWKQNNLNKIIEDEINKKFPAETEEQKKLRELTSKLEKLEREKTRESLKSKALTVATKKGLPAELADIIDNLIGEDENGTIQNIEKLEQVFTQSLSKAIEDKFKDGGRKPEQNKKSLSDMEKLEEEYKNATNNQERIKIKTKLMKLKGD